MIFLTQLLWMWVYGLLSLAVIVLAIILLYRAVHASRPKVHTRKPRHPSKDHESEIEVVDISGPGEKSHPTVRHTMIGLALFLLIWSLFGRHAVLMFRPRDSNALEPAISNSVQTIARPDGTRLYVESDGPTNGPVLILTHGWSLDARAWNYAKRDLSGHFHLFTWDLRGLGHSTEPGNRDYSLDTMAADLGAVLQFAGRPAVLVGHSIGGMINLTYCRQHPEQLGREVAGLVQIDTTYTNPVKTTSSSSFDTSMQKPMYEPLLHITIATSPLVRAMNWISYHNGLAHVMAASSSFAGAETREQLDYAARRNYEASPAVVSRGMLAMLRWDATGELPGIRVPTLIVEGEQDTTTTPAASSFMRQSMPKAELQTINRAAHLGVLEQNRLYNQAIRRFADSCFDGSVWLINADVAAPLPSGKESPFR